MVHEPGSGERRAAWDLEIRGIVHEYVLQENGIISAWVGVRYRGPKGLPNDSMKQMVGGLNSRVLCM